MTLTENAGMDNPQDEPTFARSVVITGISLLAEIALE
jgi:hypothetical protein